jgi:hypothetical protein
MRIIVLGLLIVLAGCSTPHFDATVVFTPEIYDPVKYGHDVDDCTTDMQKMPRSFSPTAIAQAGGQGAAENAGSAPVNWLIPVAGAAGKIVYETVEQLGITNARMLAAFKKCVDRKTEWDHSALDAEP